MNISVKILLYLLSKPYAGYMAVRNKLYDVKTLESKKAKLPTIGIGNITVGGTGKTPHSEYIIELLKDRYKLAYLSRGYKRKTKGWKDAVDGASARRLGDEAYQIYSKYPEIVVAVSENRLHGIAQIAKHHADMGIVVLDDVYQHRELKLDVNILLIDYNRLVYYDDYLPLGRLRENSKNTDRADVIIITKCPHEMRPVDCLSIRSQIAPYPYQKLFFSNIVYNDLKPLYDTPTDLDYNGKTIIAVSGLAESANYIAQLKTLSRRVVSVDFSDHHDYTKLDIAKIEKEIKAAGEDNTIVVITEKDKAKFDVLNLPDTVKQRIFCLGIKIDFLFGGKQEFDNYINKFAESNKK